MFGQDEQDILRWVKWRDLLEKIYVNGIKVAVSILFLKILSVYAYFKKFNQQHSMRVRVIFGFRGINLICRHMTAQYSFMSDNIWQHTEV